MTRKLAPVIITFALAILIALLAFAIGWTVAGWRKDAEIARLKTDHQTAVASAATAAAARLADAQKRGNDLQLRLAQTESTRDQLAQEKDREIRRITVGRPCLGSAAVRVLNQATEQPQPAAMPAAAGEPVRTDAAFATDTDVGIWIGQCRRSYDTCRGRLAAIAEFEAGEGQ